MKKTVALMLILALLVSLAACTKGGGTTEPTAAPALTPRPAEQQNTASQNEGSLVRETAEPAEGENGEPAEDPAVDLPPEDPGVTDPVEPDDPEEEDIEYVLNADWCEDENIWLPVLNRDYFSEALANKVDGEMRDLYAELTRDLWDFEEEGGHGPSADYVIYNTEDILSVLVYWDEASFGPEFYQLKAYCIDMDEQRLLDAGDLCSLYGLTYEDLQEQLYEVRLAYYEYYKQNFYDFEAEEDLEIETLLDWDQENLETMLRENPQNVIAYNDETFALAMTLNMPGAGAGIENTLFYASADPDYLAFFNAPYGADMYLLTNPGDDYLDAYPPEETVILSDGEFAETCVFVNNYGSLKYVVDLMEWVDDDEGGHLTLGQEMAEGTLDFAETLLLQIDRPEGVPSYRLRLFDLEAEEETTTEYIFWYNGRFGTLPIEYIAADFAVG